MDDKNVLALVDALPSLRALDLSHFANVATDAGIAVHRRCIIYECTSNHNAISP